MKKYIPAAGLFLMLAACKTGAVHKKPVHISCIPASADSSVYGKQTGTFNILSVLADGDRLTLDVEYTGCGTETTFLTWNGIFMKSLPPKVNVTPGFIQSDQECGRVIKRQLCFDIGKLRESNRKQGLVVITAGFDKTSVIPAEK